MSGYKWAKDEPPPYNPGYVGQYPEEPVGARRTQQGPWADNRGYNWDNQGQPGYSRDNQGQPGYSRDNQGQPGYNKDNQGQTGYNWDNPGQAGYSRSAWPTEDHWPRAQEMATVTSDIPEAGPAQDPLAEFTEKSIRRGFIRKVFAILAVQLLITFAFIAIFVLVKDVKEFIQDPDHIWLMFAAMATTLVLVIVMACCEKVRRKFPQNLICLAVFTLAEAWLLGTVSSYYDADEVLMAVGICTGVTTVMFLFGLQSKFDFTWLVGPLISLTFSLLCFGLLCLIFRAKYLNLMYASLGALIFSLVHGESRQVAVVQGDNVDSCVEDHPQGARVSCTPLIPYEQYTRETLNIPDSEVEKKGTTPPFVKGQDVYWLRVNIGYIGHTLEELLKASHDEAVAVLGLIHGGQVPIAIYSVAMREMNLFIQMEAGALDKTSFTLPIIKALLQRQSDYCKSCEAVKKPRHYKYSFTI